VSIITIAIFFSNVFMLRLRLRPIIQSSVSPVNTVSPSRLAKRWGDGFLPLILLQAELGLDFLGGAEVELGGFAQFFHPMFFEECRAGGVHS